MSSSAPHRQHRQPSPETARDTFGRTSGSVPARSSAPLRPPLRRIASNYLCTPHGLFAHPLVETDAAGRVVSVVRCTDPDRLAATEFHAGILLPAFVDACADGGVAEGVDGYADKCAEECADGHAPEYAGGCASQCAGGCAAPSPYEERHDLPDPYLVPREPKRHDMPAAPVAETLHATFRCSVAAPEPPSPHIAAWHSPTPTPAATWLPTTADRTPTIAAQPPTAAVPQHFTPVTRLPAPTTTAARLQPPVDQAPTTAAARLQPSADQFPIPADRLPAPTATATLFPIQRLRLSEFPIAEPKLPAADSKFQIANPESSVEEPKLQIANPESPAEEPESPAADSKLPAEALLAAIRPDRRTMIVVDRPLAQPEIDRIATRSGAPVWWCLSFRMEERHFLRAADLLHRSGQPLCTGDGTPDRPERLALLARLQRQSDIPLHRLLAWSTSCAAAAAGLPAGEVRAGLRSGVNLLSGIDYETLRLTDRSRIRRIV